MSLIGTDISRWEDNLVTPTRIDYQMMRGAKAEFVIFKATQGGAWVDPVFVADYERARNAGLITGAYHFLDWTVDADRQAEHFARQIDGKVLDFPPIVDYEYRVNVPERAAAVNALWMFVDRIFRLTGRKCMIYTSPGYWSEFGSPALVWQDYPLWIAHYGVVQPRIPAPWIKFVLWQFTANGTAPLYGCSETKGIDLNYYPGTLAELRAWLGIDAPGVEEEDIGDVEKLRRLWEAHPELH
jgi:lysozyme